MLGRKVDFRRHARRFLSRPHQAPFRSGAEGKPERVEQNRLARAGLASEHAEAGLKLEFEPFDKDDVVDGELPQHGARLALTSARPSAAASAAGRGRATAAIAC